MIDAIIYDLDGTLIDSLPAHRKIVKKVAESFGFTFTEDDFTSVNGMTPLAGIKKIIATRHLSFQAEEFMARREELISNIYDDLKLYPDTMSTLMALKDYPSAIATSSPQSYLAHVTAQFSFPKHITVSLCSDDIEQGKPAPDIFLLAAERLKVKPKDCVVIEDSVQGVKAGNRAGMKVICVLTTTPKASFAGEAHPWKFAHKLSEIPAIIADENHSI